MVESRKIWREIEVPRDQWHEYGQKLELNELQMQELTIHKRQPWVVDGDKWLVANFILPELVGRTIRRHRMCVLVGKDEAILLHSEPFDEAVSERLRIHTKLSGSPTGVLAIVADVVSERFTPILDSVDDAIDRLEVSIPKWTSDKHSQRLFHYKKVLSDLRRIVTPTMLALNSLSDGRFVLIDKKYTAYLRDSYDFAWRAHELIDTLRDLLSSMLDTYLSMMSNRMNDVMKRLTMVATIFMPISFLVGFGGMNFNNQIPFDSDLLFYTIIILMFAMPIGMMMYYRAKKWF